MRAAQRRRRSLLVLVVLGGALLIAWGLLPSPRRAEANDDHGTDNTSLAKGGTEIDPTAFTRGACVAFSPTAGDRHTTVFLDAGHGGIDPGALGTTETGQTIYEADETLPVEIDTMRILESKGFRVVVSRTGGTTVTRLTPADVSQGTLTLQGAHDDVVARDVCANDAKADLLVGIYFDSGSSQSAGSVTVYDDDRPFSSENLRFADLLQNDVLTVMNHHRWQIPDEGVLPDEQFGSYVGTPSAGGIAGEAASYDHLLLIGPAMSGYFSQPSKMPGAVIEPLFITDPFEGSIAASAQGEQVIAQGIATAVEQYFTPPPNTSKNKGAGRSD